MKQEDIDDLKQLIEFLKEHQVAEFDLDRGDLKIRLKFAQESASSASLGELARLIQSAPPASHAAPSATSAGAAAQPDAPKEAEEELHVVKSPIVGTFYASPSPGASAKLMNEIESDAAGEIVKCLVSNGQPIEFGQPLFTIRPA
jgi:acetyl-CoA carboxylase biotin carboxyl carrier protein